MEKANNVLRKKDMRQLFISIIFIIALPFSLSGSDKIDKSVRPAEIKEESNKEFLYTRDHLNTKDTYKNIIYQDTYVFMVGNNKYLPASGVAELSQCYNDLTLLKGIFTRCLKIPEHNIFIHRDVNLDKFRNEFQKFIRSINKKSRVFFLLHRSWT